MFSRKIIKVNYIDQTKNYPTGCESISTVMCLNYNNIFMTPEEYINNHLEKGEMYFKDNIRYAPDPNEKFIGSPYNKYSYGCYEPVIEKSLNKILTEKNLNDKFEVKNLNDVEMDILIKDYIDKDIPIIFWATIDLKPYFEGSKWIIPETGKEYTWRAREHCLLLVGYDKEEKKYYFNDPWDNHGCIGYDMDLVEKRHKEQYSMAVALIKK